MSRASLKADTAADGSTATERRQAKRLFIVLVVIAIFFVFELIGAKAAESDVLQADAFHLLMDVFALAVSLGAMRLATTRPSPRFTFGLRRAEPLAALANGVLVIGVAIEIVRDAVEHLEKSASPRPGIMLVVASAALVVNGISAWLLHGAMHLPGHGHSHGHDHSHGHGHSHEHEHEHEHDHEEKDDEHSYAHAREGGHHLNLRGAWLHLLGDALGSLAAFAAGIAIRFGAPPMVDPLASFFVVAILLVGAYRLFRDAGLVLLDAAPPRLSVARVKEAILAQPGVSSVHALHVWSLGTGHDAVTVHVTTADSGELGLGAHLADILRTKYNAEYVTVQVDVDTSHGSPRCDPED